MRSSTSSQATVGDVSKDLLGLLTQLLPGFVAAWVLYALTSHLKPSQFERVVQALIFSYLIQVLVAVEQEALLFAGRWISFGQWSDRADLVASALTAIAFGLIGAHCVNNDILYRAGRRLRITKRTSHPSEWFNALNVRPRHLVLHLSGGRRLIGYPAQWPSEPTVGHFEVVDAAWLGDGNELTELPQTESLLIGAKDVEMIEFLKSE